jgi:hypothetical protein
LHHVRGINARADPRVGYGKVLGGAMQLKQVVLAAGFVSMFAGSALAQDTTKKVITPSERKEIRRDGHEVRQDKREVKQDRREIAGDRREIRRDIKRGDSVEARKDAKELREDRRDKKQDRHDLIDDKKDRRQDVKRAKKP